HDLGAATHLTGEGRAARLRRAGRDARRLGRLLPGERDAGVDAVDREDLAGDLCAARRPELDHPRHRSRLGGCLAPLDHRRPGDADRARGLPCRGAAREEAREAEAVRMIELRVAETDDELEAWRRVRIAVVPNERTDSVEELRQSASGERLLLLAYREGELAGSGVGGRGDTASGFAIPRVLPKQRRRGIGTVLLHALAEHVEA